MDGRRAGPATSGATITAMTKYGFLLLPSHNRVYAKTAPQLAHSELLAVSESMLGGRVREVAETVIGGVPYLTFAADRLGQDDLGPLAALSSLYALFEIHDDGRLTPVALPPLDRFDSDLLSIQKYSGKTNEDFTKLLLHVTAMASDWPERLLTGNLRVLDPLCGRGTTLNQALMYGLDAAGVERDTKSFEAYTSFLKNWLKNSRLKHQAESGTVRAHRTHLGRRFHVSLGETKELYRAGQTTELTMVNADTVTSDRFFRPRSFDLIVTDAPYGVQHGSRTKAGGRAGEQEISRSPLTLLADALPVWVPLLRPGGAIGISWNTYVAERAELAGLLADNGLEVRDTEPYRHFKHRVDQAIVRDVLVARKPHED